MNGYPIDSYVEAHKNEMLEKFEQLVRLESHFEEKENVLKAMAWVQKEFEAEGFTCRIEGTTDKRAGLLIGMLGAERPASPVILSGHIDTVHRQGSFGEGLWRVDGDKVYGAGVNDMKGGIIEALYIVKALNAQGYDRTPLKILFAGDEEGDHIGTDTNLLYTRESRGALAAFNMETGVEGVFTVARKSCHIFHLTVEGQGGHAGNDFNTSHNAVEEAMHKAQEIVRLTDIDKGTTVATTVIRGGDHPSAIPASCEVTLDARVSSPEEKERIYRSVREICGKAVIPGTKTAYDCYAAKYEGYTENDKIRKLHSFVNEIAEELGQPAYGKCYRGGAADSGNMAIADIPVLCSCGIVGDFSHDRKEFALLHTLYDRTKLFASVIAEIDRFSC
ncbi:MAG: M20/M25/M40 family metallo-hydrolase [Bacillota bacterium]|nr:M20/M25/M40 family metallo-hydrolase [Bacillota bacterium]NLV69459.1 M20 family metallopeptidase [Clostridiales bacterium]